MAAIIIPLKPSLKAKATMKAAVAKDQQAKALQDQSPLKSRADMKGFAAQYPKTFGLLGIIFTTWRGSSSHRQGIPGCWAAYTYPWWGQQAQMPVATLKRHLDRLEQHGLIERGRGHHQGTRVLTFMRPTALALKLSNTRPADWDHLGASPDEPEAPPAMPKAFKPAPVKAAPKPVPEEEKPLTPEQALAILNADDDAPESISD